MELFIHPKTKKTCLITRYISENHWFYRVLTDPGKVEIRASMKYSEIEFLGDQGLEVGDYVKIIFENYVLSNVSYTEQFMDFLESNRDKSLKISKIEGAIVYIEDCIYTFWIGNVKRTSYTLRD